MFYRSATDGIRTRVPLENQYAGPTSTPCWIIGGGPSLTDRVMREIVAAPGARFGINLAGSGGLRPHFWTSYDPTARFHKSIYLDPAVTKFVHEGRAMDLVPDTTFKVCECPALYLIDREQQRGFHNFPGSGEEAITDWQDSLIQAIDIAYRLGFRQLYLAGCDMWIAPSRRLIQQAESRQVTYRPRELLGDFLRRCEGAGMSRDLLEQLSTGPQYHFTERKSLTAAVQTDAHYFRVAQALRLCRRSLALAGLSMISVTPASRLNDDFPYLPLRRACQQLRERIGDPAREETRGRYSESSDRRPEGLGPMRDVRPHFWNAAQRVRPAGTVGEACQGDPLQKQQRLAHAVRELPEIAVTLDVPAQKQARRT